MEAIFAYPLGVDPASLDKDQRLSLLESIEHARAALDAQQQLTLSTLAREGDAEARSSEWVREEIAAALSIAPATAAPKLHEATDLLDRLPHTSTASSTDRSPCCPSEP